MQHDEHTLYMLSFRGSPIATRLYTVLNSYYIHYFMYEEMSSVTNTVSTYCTVTQNSKDQTANKALCCSITFNLYICMKITPILRCARYKVYSMSIQCAHPSGQLTTY